MGVSFRNAIVSFFLLPYFTKCIDYLAVAPEECRSRTLAAEEGFETMETLDLEVDGANFDMYNPLHQGDTSRTNVDISDGQGMEMRDMEDEEIQHSRSATPRSRPISQYFSFPH